MDFFRKICDWLISISNGNVSIFIIIFAILSVISFFAGKHFIDGDEHEGLGLFLEVVLSFLFGFLAFILFGAWIGPAL